MITLGGFKKRDSVFLIELCTGELKRSQNIFHQILVTFEVNNLATSNWDKVATTPVKIGQGVAPGRVRERDVQLIR